MLEEELGIPVQEAFVELDEKPLAAASLAQVHRGVIRAVCENDGAKLVDSNSSDASLVEVAVKLQYPGLSQQVVGDLWAKQVLANAVGFFFEDFEYAWLLPEFGKLQTWSWTFVRKPIIAGE